MADIEQELRANNPFAKIADSAAAYDYATIADLFCPPSTLPELLNGSNHFLVGSIGTGKTIVLRALSTATQGSQLGARLPTIAGFYVAAPAHLMPRLTMDAPTQVRDALTHYFVLYVMSAVLDQLQTSERYAALMWEFGELIQTVAGISPHTRTAQPSTARLSAQMRSVLRQLDVYPPPATFEAPRCCEWVR